MRLPALKTSTTLLAITLATAGCVKMDGKVNGGGTMNSMGGAGKAVMTFNAERCDEQPVKGQVNFQDKTAIDWENDGGVSFRANVVEAGLCGEDIEFSGDAALACDQRCGPGEFEVAFEYDSTNPQLPGEGTGVACLVDWGEGVNASYRINGMASISVDTGPFSSYANRGALSGNVQTQECPSTKNDKNDEENG
ncbi:hypothetical protein [Microbulbifer sp. YPW1]|uniref:hypothetical protein n=1 Tax=Microbulbifer sp. YPW1 TaxID=2745199 RepID=UPI001597C812|nr:hypothetical protein [Microbulbifer sp. YPW1]QKX16410.1 hypothetical protein HUW35_05070 [Microbulbifer sp. YPW1]